MDNLKFKKRYAIDNIEDIPIVPTYIRKLGVIIHLKKHRQPGIYSVGKDVFGYKKVKCSVFSKKYNNLIDNYDVVLELIIPKSSFSTIVVSSKNSGGMRTNKAYVNKILCNVHHKNTSYLWKKAYKLGKDYYCECDTNDHYFKKLYTVSDYPSKYAWYKCDFRWEGFLGDDVRQSIFKKGKLVKSVSFNQSDKSLADGISFFPCSQDAINHI